MRLHQWLSDLWAQRVQPLPVAAPVAPHKDSALRMSGHGRAVLMVREGVVLKTYVDSVGVKTCCVGHTAAAGPPYPALGQKFTHDECEKIFARDLVKYEQAVIDAVNVPLSQGEFDALVSLCFNIGPAAFKTSTVVRRLNAGDRLGAAAAMLMWNKPPEIMGRRKGEYQQFAQAAGIPPDVWIA